MCSSRCYNEVQGAAPPGRYEDQETATLVQDSCGKHAAPVVLCNARYLNAAGRALEMFPYRYMSIGRGVVCRAAGEMGAACTGRCNGAQPPAAVQQRCVQLISNHPEPSGGGSYAQIR